MWKVGIVYSDEPKDYRIPKKGYVLDEQELAEDNESIFIPCRRGYKVRPARLVSQRQITKEEILERQDLLFVYPKHREFRGSTSPIILVYYNAVCV